MLDKISLRVKEAVRMLKQLGYVEASMSPREFHVYITSETPQEDLYQLSDVLTNQFLVLHEVVEISELKKESTLTSKPL